MRIIVVGAGGHGQVVVDALLASIRQGADLTLLGFADDAPTLWGEKVLGVPVLGRVADALATPHDGIVVAIGNNARRRDLTRQLATAGETFVSVIHPQAVVSPGAIVGPGSMILAGAVVNTGAYLGLGVIVNTCASLDHHNQIGDYVHIAPGAHLGGNVRVGEGALIGLGTSVMPQRAIGAWAITGAGATVVHDVPAGATVVGIPARIIKNVEETA